MSRFTWELFSFYWTTPAEVSVHLLLDKRLKHMTLQDVKMSGSLLGLAVTLAVAKLSSHSKGFCELIYQ